MMTNRTPIMNSAVSQSVPPIEPMVWIIDDDSAIRWVLEKTCLSSNLRVLSFENGQVALDALDALEEGHVNLPDVVMSDIRMGTMDGLTFLNLFKQTHAHIPVIMMTAHSDLESAVASYQTGAFEYLPKPFDIDDALEKISRAVVSVTQEKLKMGLSQVAVSPEKATLTDDKKLPNPVAKLIHSDTLIIGESPAMQDVFRMIGRLSQADISVLINGESGTGKELVANALHQHSPRKSMPFIALNMAAIPKDLIESELFGHEKGAFTGAATQRVGRFEQADGGTLFLDEIGDMPFEAQTRLLRVLAEGEFYRVGGRLPVRVNVRIVAATHQNLENLVTQGVFREDLYHRLNVIRIRIPKLAERTEDIDALAIYFLAKASQELNVPCKTLHPDTLLALRKLRWTGNVRQLENTCRYLTVMASGQEVITKDLPQELLLELDTLAPELSGSQAKTALTATTEINTATHTAPSPIESIVPIIHATAQATTPVLDTQDATHVNIHTVTLEPTISFWQSAVKSWALDALAHKKTALMDEAMPAFEQIMIETVLAYTGGKKQLTAQILGLGRNTLTRKLQQFGIDDEDE